MSTQPPAAGQQSLPPSALEVAAAAAALGLRIEIEEFPGGTRSAEAAAKAVGCQLGQIVKSLVFSVEERPVMALVSGANRLDERKLAGLCGVGRKQVRRADAATVRAATGFAIGGVPPFGHKTRLKVYVDADLERFDRVWAAAGTPCTVFPVAPAELVRVSRGASADLKLERES